MIKVIIGATILFVVGSLIDEFGGYAEDVKSAFEAAFEYCEEGENDKYERIHKD